jgi:cardiolipin synthase
MGGEVLVPGLTLLESGFVCLTIYWLLVLVTVPSVLLQKEGHPVAALAWILAMFVLPPVGAMAWWTVGRSHLRSRRRKRRRAREEVLHAIEAVRSRTKPPAGSPTSLLDARRLPPEFLDSISAPSPANCVRLLPDTRQAYAAWEEAIRSANDHVHFLYYAWGNDASGRRFRDLLAQAAARGVEVRCLFDAVGSPRIDSAFLEPLRAAGGRVYPFLPPRLFTLRPVINFRNHRKILVVDNRRAFIGGINIGDVYLEWNDLAVEIRGPEVDRLQEVFAEDWYFTVREELTRDKYFGQWVFCEGQADGEWAPAAFCATISSGPEQELNATREMLFLAFTKARKRIWILTPYFVPYQSIQAALRSAVYRGVDVQLLVPARNDIGLIQRASRSFFPGLLHGGIRIFEYLPRMLHAKAVVLDDDLLFIGSANMDTRSFKLNFEASCFIESQKLNGAGAELFQGFRRESREVTRQDLRRRPYFARVADAAVHLLSPLL